jgi:hypothetical protein
LTGIMTRPNEMAPFHILRMVCQYPFCSLFSVRYQATAWEVVHPIHAAHGPRRPPGCHD